MSHQLQSLDEAMSNMQMYGYYVSEKWLHEIALSFLAKLHPDISETKAVTNARGNPSYSFRKTFHIHSLSTAYAILPPGQIVPAECMFKGAVHVLYIFNDQPYSYRYRPTQKQVDELTRFMGREPQWGQVRYRLGSKKPRLGTQLLSDEHLGLRMRSLKSSSIDTVTNFDWPTRMIDVMINMDLVNVIETLTIVHTSARSVGVWPVVCKVIEPQHKLHQRRGEYQTHEKVDEG
ncbi:uncharacterized protein EDB93DRAFT_1100525 [Suillus bovinus]|uniref:uncharacterized protein n=1 Tax=Suillus bovinus TaxID=48563 RepID=UPI001B882DAD|nr:uncharacterized protein EDB93DRAFT_1100525 [Suillus bovinus]KAG2158320.1 hypothetical protein EDB93DRAFT_1100525 [Suillus bovinus]